jgi:hypothetical protein
MSSKIAWSELECLAEVAELHRASLYRDRQYGESVFLVDEVLESNGGVSHLEDLPGSNERGCCRGAGSPVKSSVGAPDGLDRSGVIASGVVGRSAGRSLSRLGR